MDRFNDNTLHSSTCDELLHDNIIKIPNEDGYLVPVHPDKWAVFATRKAAENYILFGGWLREEDLIGREFYEELMR